MGVPYTPEQLKKLGLIEVNGIYVKVSSQVAKKVDKLPSLIERAIPLVNDITDAQMKMKVALDKVDKKEGIPMFNTAPTAEETHRIFKEQGIMYAKPFIGDTFLLPNGEYVDVKYRFVIEPIPAPRMTQSDKWKTDPNHPDPKKRQRKPVENYFRFKNRLVSLCEISGYKLTKTLNIIFVVPFPKSYSAKRKAELDGRPHDQKPDIDNFSKCWMDSLSDNDREVWNLHAIKVWGYEGQIIIF